ncbi:hypothetical protein [Mycolicibacterium hodleri]|uniref:Uncharacterized protein n=1 Tax=Mycolicibacterium hodleri TaxID=49897 RepID=A0A502E479_9MYCO|nr:hypothetical protein [Mycolicibacterium hodleri]TPG31759.1 hypothetical protein EAH80_22835 [Mycolicibacterium hodleri]
MIPIIIAAVLAFGAGWYTNSQTIQAQKDQAVDQFRRDQRREQYATILQQATRLENASGFSSTAVGALSSLALFGAATGKGIQDRIGDGESSTTVPNRDVLPSSSLPDLGKTNSAQENVKDAMHEGLGGLSDIRDSWQSAYTGLDQAISNSEIASSTRAISLARALRDKYRDDYYQSVLSEIDRSLPFFPDPKPDRVKLALSLVGVTVDNAPVTYDKGLLAKSTDELTELYVDAAKADLGLNDR